MADESWRELESQARWRLEHADQAIDSAVTRGMSLQLRLWSYRRSGSHVSWSIILPVRDYRSAKAVVREVAWDRVADLKSLLRPQRTLKRRQALRPSLCSRDAEMGWQELAPHLDSIAGLRPSILERAPTEAGVEDSFGLVGYRSLAHVRIEWGGRGPRAWKETIALITRLRQLLCGMMQDRERHSQEG